MAATVPSSSPIAPFDAALVESVIDLDYFLDKILEGFRWILQVVFDRVFESLVEGGSQGVIVPVQFCLKLLELSEIVGRGSLLFELVDCPCRRALFVKWGSEDLLEPCLKQGEAAEDTGSILVKVLMFVIISEDWLELNKNGSSEM